MKKFFSFVIASILLLLMSVNVFAAENTGSITITNPTVGVEYKIYKIFDASPAFGEGTNENAVSYSIQKNNQFFEDMFGDPDNPDNDFANDIFYYNANSGNVRLKEGVGESTLVSYLNGLITPAKTTAAPSQTGIANKPEIVFDDLPYGYYLVTSTLGTAVTIDSNMPDVKVIDKNQKPNSDNSFNKQVKIGVDSETGKPIWAESNSANIGDMAEYKVSFVATNYNGDKVIQYYSIRDIKSSSLWVEFNNITVTVIEQKDSEGNPVNEKTHTMTKGYYYCANPNIDTLEWKYLGEWGNDTNPDNAEWYLIHYGYDEFEIVIPWMDDYKFTGVQDMQKGYELTFDLDKNDGNNILSESLYDSPSDVEVEYYAAVGPDAANDVAINSVYLDWITADGTYGPEEPQKTETRVYNLGIIKIANDGTNTTAATRLAGATFELFSDEACSQPVYVIPTNNKGVYILDDLGNTASGINKETARKKYVTYWEEYIAEATNNPKQRNDMTTPENGQLVVMGLKAGTYYLKETVAPPSYNSLSGTISVVVGPGGTDTTILSGYKELPDAEGNKKDITYFVYKTTVVNSVGTELPATGGEGTVRMITIGTMIAMAFAVLLITHKKMSIYQD